MHVSERRALNCTEPQGNAGSSGGVDGEKIEPASSSGSPIRVAPIERTVYGTKSGLPLDPEKVRQGRQREMDNVHAFGVKRDMRMHGAKRMGLKLVHTRWLDDLKATAGDPDAVRSRLVAIEINTYVREDVSQSTPSLLSSRLIVVLAASMSGAAGSSAASRDRLIARYDIRDSRRQACRLRGSSGSWKRRCTARARPASAWASRSSR